MQRSATMRRHAGQPAFPGGASDPGDADAVATALREATEEVGLDPASTTTVATLPKLWIPVSGFVVTPVLSWWHTPHLVHPASPAEVEGVYRVPIAELADPDNRMRVRMRGGYIGPGLRGARHARVGLHGRCPRHAAGPRRLERAVGHDRIRDLPRYPERVSGSVVDLVLIALIVLFAVNGYRQGFLIGALSFVGFFGGALIGLQLAPWVVGSMTGAFARVLVSLSLVFGLALLGQAGAGWLGGRLRLAIHNEKGQRVDDVGGVIVSVLALLAVAWMVAVPLASSPMTGLARSVRNSAILHAIDAVVPDGARVLYNRLQDTIAAGDFPQVFGDLTPTRARQVDPPDPALVALPAVEAGAPVRGQGDRHRAVVPAAHRGHGFCLCPPARDDQRPRSRRHRGRRLSRDGRRLRYGSRRVLRP